MSDSHRICVSPRITAIGTAAPDCDVHARYTEWAVQQLDDRKAALFARMEQRGGIAHRYSVLSGADAAMDFGSFYMSDAGSPGTAARMAVTYPPGPEPIMTTSKDSATDLSILAQGGVAALRCSGGSPAARRRPRIRLLI